MTLASYAKQIAERKTFASFASFKGSCDDCAMKLIKQKIILRLVIFYLIVIIYDVWHNNNNIYYVLLLHVHLPQKI